MSRGTKHISTVVKEIRKRRGIDPTEKPEKPAPPIVREEREQVVRVTLTSEELLDAGQRLADAQQTITNLNGELTSFKEQMKGKVAEAEGQATRYGALVRQRYEHRAVKCDVVKDYGQKTYTVTRKDTGEVIESRPMTNGELETLPMAVADGVGAAPVAASAEPAEGDGE